MRRREFPALLAGCVFSLRAAPAPPGALVLARKCDRALKGRSQVGQLAMTVQRPEWKRTLEMEYWSVNPDRTFIRVRAPAKERGMTTLRLKSNMWIYMPRVERIIKVPPSLMLQPWMGSDFTNDDLVRESSLVVDYTHTVDGELSEGGDECWRLLATPKPDAPVVWGKLVLVIRKSDALPRRQEFYDERGRLQKVLRFSGFRQLTDRRYPMRWQMVPVRKPGRQTVLVFEKLTFDQTIPARIFTQQNLKRRR